MTKKYYEYRSVLRWAAQDWAPDDGYRNFDQQDRRTAAISSIYRTISRRTLSSRQTAALRGWIPEDPDVGHQLLTPESGSAENFQFNDVLCVHSGKKFGQITLDLVKTTVLIH